LRAGDDVCLHFEYRNLVRYEHHVKRAARSTREALLFIKTYRFTRLLSAYFNTVSVSQSP